MADRVIAKKHLSELDRIKKNVEDAHQYFKRNIARYHKIRRFVLETSISTTDKQKLDLLQKPDVEFNVLEAYISRLRGEFSKQIPSVSVRALNPGSDPLTMKVVEGHIRHIFDEANSEQFSNKIYMDTLSGGYSVIKLTTEYDHAESFDQKIKIARVYDPTLCVFDPLAEKPDKGDAQFACELYPQSRTEFEKEHPTVSLDEVNFYKTVGDFSWYSYNDNNEIVMLADYYEKKKTRFKLHKLADGQIIDDKRYKAMKDNWDGFTQPPESVEERWSERVVIMRYKFIGEKLLEAPTETDFESLPLIFVDGNSSILKNSPNAAPYQFTRPYVYQALGAQRFKNYVGQTFAAEVENMEQHKWLVEKEAIPESFAKAWTTPQIPGSLVWQARNKDGLEIPQPVPVSRVPIPPEIFGSFNGADSTIQNILGSYDAALGINDNQLSGVAIVEGATQSNATAMPYVMNFMSALDKAAKIIVEMIPKYYVTPRTIPILLPDGKKEYANVNQMSVPPATLASVPSSQAGGGAPLPNQGGMPDPSQAPQQQQAPQEQQGPPGMQQGMPPGGQQQPQQGPSPQLISMMYPKNTLDVKIEVGKNFKIEKHRAIEQLTKLGQAFPVVSEFINQKGLGFIISNLDINGADELKEEAYQFEQQMEAQKASQSQQQNPAMMDMALKAQKQKLEEQKLMQDNQFRQLEIQLENEKIQNEKMKIVMASADSVAENHVQLTKAQTEREGKAADLAVANLENTRRHSENLSKGEKRNDDRK